MGFHHVALATRDIAATHRFYTEAMGFSLVKTVVAPVPGSPDGWSKHYFYDTGSDGMIAFWELHDKQFADVKTNLNEAVGLPGWVNHFAYNAPTRAFLDERRATWCSLGHMVAEVDHEFCVSIYTLDPDGNTVEFCHDLRDFTDTERSDALRLMRDPSPAMDKDAKVTVHPPTNGG